GPAPNNSLQPPKETRGDFRKGYEAHISCAFGCGYVHTEYPPQIGKNIFICPRCKGRTTYEARDKTIVISPKEYQGFRGKLIMVRQLWSNKEFKLYPGSNVVGRYDSDPRGNSDIAITDDPSMSRRSIDIRVEYDDLRGYVFELNVLRATNPVLVNHEPKMPGDSFALNFGDSIILGKTLFRFEKDI
ncbi:MAG: FHA domain-containing protein, partial [Muribaculaceae bacterium]|nr:FHA domain-containing protein [Muribaculaceae bacterium]